MNDRAADALRIMRFNAALAIEYAEQHPDWRRDRLVTDAIAKRVEEVAEAARTRFHRRPETAACGGPG